APRDILENALEADWSPDGSALAVTRYVEGRTRLEYPAGKVLYETSGYISSPRVSPAGDRVAFLDHQIQGDTRGWLAVVDSDGKKNVLSGEWSGIEGLAWRPDGKEIWYTANRTGTAFSLHAVTLSGSERGVAAAPGNLILQDIATNGRVL